ncbi:MAG: class I SAM-dependent methyltransferase [Hyphomicrobiales bacterium]|nr:MAG: class I SAM-dependent methyltransferase [Hyphomicrobiales bacterium]
MTNSIAVEPKAGRSFARMLIDSQRWLSRKFDQVLPEAFTIDGNADFVRNFAPPYLRPGTVIFDIGSGKRPFLTPDHKRQLGVRVAGLDIDAGELAAAPEGVYDDAICADVTQYQGKGDADLVICQALLEHVDGTHLAFRAMATSLKPGGTAVLFVPSRNAAFARLNLLLPESLKRRILFTVFPEARHAQGFKSYYDRCTPRDFRRMAEANGLEVSQLQPYYTSAYFTFCFPLHFVWRLWVIAFRAAAGEQAAETFCMALRKK